MKKVSVLLAFVCQPYLAILQKRLYLRYWKDEVDEVLINVNGRNDLIRNFIISLWKDDSKVKCVDDMAREIRQGLSFDCLYYKATGNVLMTLDSDNFIYKKGIVEKYSNFIHEKKYSSIGSSGLHINPSLLIKIATDKYKTVRLNPFMSFWDKGIMDSIGDVTFKTYNFKKGDYFAPLGNMSTDGWMDIMTKLSLEFFSKSFNCLLIPQVVHDEYIHAEGISSVYRRNFKCLEDNNNQKFIFKKYSDCGLSYYVWLKFIFDITKDELSYKEYNQEFEKGFNDQFEKLKMDKRKFEALYKDLKNYYQKFI